MFRFIARALAWLRGPARRPDEPRINRKGGFPGREPDLDPIEELIHLVGETDGGDLSRRAETDKRARRIRRRPRR